MPSAGQLVATTQRTKPQPAVDESVDFHNTQNIQSSKLKQPTAKEMAAAKAARIRLGHEQADDAAGADELVSIYYEICLPIVWIWGLCLAGELCVNIVHLCRLPSCPMAQSHHVQST